MSFLIALTDRGTAEVKPWTWDPTESIDTQIQKALGLPLDPSQRMRMPLHYRGHAVNIWTTPQPDDITDHPSRYPLNLIASAYLDEPTLGPIAITGHDSDTGVRGLTALQAVEEGTVIAEHQARIKARIAWLSGLIDH